MSGTICRKLLYIFPAVILLCILFTGVRKAEAGTKPTISDSEITLYEGNKYKLTYTTGADNGQEEPDPDVDFWAWMNWYYGDNYHYFTSSDMAVAMVDDYGVVTAMGKGTATVTLCSNYGSASVSVKVKSNGAKLSESELTLYIGQNENVRLTWQGKDISGYDAVVYCRDSFDPGYFYESGGVRVENRNNGTFNLRAESEGTYDVYLILKLGEKSYSKKLSVTVLKSGLTYETLSVAVGCSVDIEMTNADFVSARVKQSDWWNSYDGGIGISGDRITGTKTGSTRVEVTYKPAYGGAVTADITVYVTDPEYVPFTEALRVGNAYNLKYNGGSYYSRITIESSDTSVAAQGTESWNSDSVVPIEYGTCRLSITIDGRQFTDTVTVINPKLSFEDCLIKKGKTKTLKVTGVPEGTVITYRTSSKKIATVSETGKIKGVKTGSCYITVNVDGTKMLCTVNVGTGTSTKAVLAGADVLGSKYSQDRRMEKGYYDCSSFAWRSYNTAGYKLGGVTYAPTAADLAKKLEAEGKAISYKYTDASKLKPGDLIFYTGYSNGRYKDIDHVAVYYGAYYCQDGWSGVIENEGMIIHAVSAGVVMRQYTSYRTGDIVMICRPMKK